jgi:hypothetical protein
MVNPASVCSLVRRMAAGYFARAQGKVLWYILAVRVATSTAGLPNVVQGLSFFFRWKQPAFFFFPLSFASCCRCFKASHWPFRRSPPLMPQHLEGGETVVSTLP